MTTTPVRTTAPVMTAAVARRSRRDRAVDVACVALSAFVALLWAGDAVEARHWPTWYVVGSLAAAAVATVAVWWRRRWPVALALALLVPSAVTEAVGGAGLVAIFTVAVHRPARVAVAVAVAHLLVVVPYSVVEPDPDLGGVGFHVLNITLLSVVVGWGMLIRRRRWLVGAGRERATRAETETRLRDERVRGLERERIAREMHDVLAHRISLVSLHAGALELRPDLPAEDVARTAGIIRTSAHQALDDLREILGVLRGGEVGDGLGPRPGLDHLDDLVAEARAGGTPVDLRDQLAGGPVPPASAGRTAYRVIQEGLTNARKHAPGAPVEVCLAGAPGTGLHVWLRNPLVVAPGRSVGIPGARAGLVGLTERVGLTGGRLEHGARRGPDGVIAFHLEAWLPWPA